MNDPITNPSTRTTESTTPAVTLDEMLTVVRRLSPTAVPRVYEVTDSEWAALQTLAESTAASEIPFFAVELRVVPDSLAPLLAVKRAKIARGETTSAIPAKTVAAARAALAG